MKIHVIRHGQTELNKKGIFNGHVDESLSSDGIENVSLQTFDLDKILESDFI